MELLIFQEKKKLHPHTQTALSTKKKLKLETNMKFEQKYVFLISIVYNLKFYKGKT